jgi:NAD(P)-dependent dehydrogenase (short-subunit alcohol dehydrogenase family)
MPHAGPLAGQAVVVLGASRGIGKAIALACAAAGAEVTVAARRDGSREFPGALPDTLAEIRAAGGSAEAAFCDVTDPAEVDALVDGVAQRCGRLDVVINSSVLISYETLFEIVPETWRRVFAVNVEGPFHLTRAAARAMMAAGPAGQGGGRIIHLTGTGAHDVKAVNALTGASKAALERFVRGAAEELRPQGIAVNLFDPGPVKTERALVLRGESFPWSAFALPAAVAPAAVRLALQDSRAVTGQTYSYAEHKAAHS